MGAGNGLNFAHYPPSVTEVVAVEPEPYLRERDTLAAIKAAGFIVDECRSFEFRPAPAIPTSPHILGIARRP